MRRAGRHESLSANENEGLARWRAAIGERDLGKEGDGLLANVTAYGQLVGVEAKNRQEAELQM